MAVTMNDTGILAALTFAADWLDEIPPSSINYDEALRMAEENADRTALLRELRERLAFADSIRAQPERDIAWKEVGEWMGHLR